ncbi:MAG: SBBP repeat-containing protein [Acidobacteriaceae bacterium]
MLREWLCKPATQASLVLPLALGLAGCGNNLYHTIGPPPSDTVTFPTASTQGWLQQYGTGYVSTAQYSHNGDTAYGVATDAQGNVIVVDQTYGAFPGFVNNGSAEFAVVKFDNSGNRIWTQQLGTGSGDYPNAIAVDAQGNIFVGGATDGAFPGFTNSAGAEQCVVIKLTPAGQTSWIQQFSSSLPCQVTALAADAQGNVIVGSESLNNVSNGYTQGGDVSKLAAATGATLWNQGYAGTNSMSYGVTGVGVDNQGNVVAVGDFPSTGTSNSTTDMAVKLDGSTGQPVWQQAPATFSPYGGQLLIYTQLALDANGNVFLGGVDQTSGYNTCAVAELTSAGTQQWQQEFGAAQGCIPGGMATDTAGNVLMTGNMEVPFFPSSNPPWQDDAFVAKLTGSGQAVWLQQFGTGSDVPKGTYFDSALVFVSTDSQNHAYVAGTTRGAFPGFTNSNNVHELFVTQFAP